MGEKGWGGPRAEEEGDSVGEGELHGKVRAWKEAFGRGDDEVPAA